MIEREGGAGFQFIGREEQLLIYQIDSFGSQAVGFLRQLGRDTSGGHLEKGAVEAPFCNWAAKVLLQCDDRWE